MNAADFIDRGVTDCERCSAVQIPAHLKIADSDIVIIRIICLLFIPLPAISGEHPRAVVCHVFLNDQIPDLLRGIKYADIKINSLQIIIGSIANA